MNYCEEVTYKSDEAHDKLTVTEYGYRALIVKLLSMAYPDTFVHRYENYKDLRESGGPEVDQEKCLRQLSHLVDRADTNLKLGFRTKDIDFYRLLDTYGRVPSGMFSGDLIWLGAYDACLGMKINLPQAGEAPSTGFRYCLASLRLKDWPNEDKTLEHVTVFKSAVCLPRACDSVSYKHKYNLVQKLIEFNAREVDLNAAIVSNIYCLPDERSNLRIWWKSTPTLIVVGCLSVWLALLVYSTYKDEKHQRDQQLKASSSSGDSCAATSAPPGESYMKLYRSLSITSNLRSLFSTAKASSLIEVGSAASEKLVDLDMIEGIKVLAAIYIICGHVMMICTGLVRNGKEMSDTTSVSFVMSNLMPAFAVNIFFSITGILTAYLMFKQDQSHSFISSPIKWVAFIFYRYLRIMPMYALVTLFCKHVARYIGDGPMWDYGTSSLAARRNCEHESWAWTLLFGANFKSPLKHCIPSAWYLANDFQFFIVTPIFLAALHLKPKLGKRLLVASIVAGYIAGFWNVLASEANDIRPIALFMPHGFMTYITFLYENYTRPQYRIPAYLVGLLMGRALYEYELRRQAYLEQQRQRQKVEEGTEHSEHPRQEEEEETANESCWPNWMIRQGTTIGISAAILVIITPSVGSRLPLDKFSARLLVAFIMPTYHLVYAVGVGIYILLATTGHGNKFLNGILSMKFWKPLARLSLCVVLVNVEVIAYIAQTHKATHSLTNQYHTCLNMLSISCTYLVATVVCVLFEAPVRAALNHVLAFAMQRAAIKKKTA